MTTRRINNMSSGGTQARATIISNCVGVCIRGKGYNYSTQVRDGSEERRDLRRKKSVSRTSYAQKLGSSGINKYVTSVEDLQQPKSKVARRAI